MSAAHGTRIFGRDIALEQITEFLGGVGSGPTTIIVAGEHGMGRTTLWRYAVATARDLGYRVLASRAAEQEQTVACLALDDLFGDLLAGVASDGSATPAFDLGREVLATLRRLAVDTPVLVAIDNGVWLDPTSANALRFALHRLTDERVGVLCTMALGSSTPVVPLGLQHGHRLDLGPLPLEVLRKVLAGTVSKVSHPQLVRAHERSGGNPGLAIELLRSWRGERSDRGPQDRLAVAELPVDTVTVLRTLAMAGPAAVGVVASAAEVDDFAAAVRSAVDAGTIEVSEDLTMRFRDPHSEQVLLAGMNPLDRCAVHARLAAATPDPAVRARHRALATPAPVEALARELERIATLCVDRGSPVLAAELAGHAVRLTPPDDVDAAARRASAEIAHWASAGETARALQLADGLLKRMEPGPRRAQVLAQRVFLDFGESEGFLRQALTDVGDDQALRARILDLLGWQYGLYQGRLADGLTYSRQALELALSLGDAEVTVTAAATLAATSLLNGHPRDDLFRQAVEQAETVQLSPLGRWPRVFWARHLLWYGHLGDARQIFRRMQQDALVRGSEFQRPYRLIDLAMVDLAAGDLGRARLHALDGIEAARDAGNEGAVVWLAHPLGLAAALQGDAATAIWAADLLAEWALVNGEPPRQTMANEILGNLAATQGDWTAAFGRFHEMLHQLDAMGYQHPGARPGLSRAIEAGTMLGDIAAVETLTARLAAQASAVRAPLVDALLLAAEGQLALLQGEDPLPPLTAAAEHLNRLGYHFEAARVRLQLARVWLRDGQRTNARAAAMSARAVFADADAPAWATVADTLRMRADAAPQPGRLTASELEVATLVADGRMNREVALALFVSTSTVEAHLTRIYRKLQLRHRTELAAWIHDRQRQRVSSET